MHHARLRQIELVVGISTAVPGDEFPFAFNANEYVGISPVDYHGFSVCIFTRVGIQIMCDGHVAVNNDRQRVKFVHFAVPLL